MLTLNAFTLFITSALQCLLCLTVWQHPYVNIFKHMRVEEWKKTSREGDVTTYMDKTLMCTVFRIRGSIPASNYILLPKTSTQSLGLTGRYLYLLFRPSPAKHFVVHMDIAAEEGQVIRVSFSNLFKEFKSTATWLQFPFLCGFFYWPGLVGPAPSTVRWTCLMMDLQYILSVYLNRRHSHLKTVKLCANMSVKNMFTSDLVAHCARPATGAGLASSLGTGPMPREMSFPVPKGGSWHDLYDYIRWVASPGWYSNGGENLIEKATCSPAERSPMREMSRSVNISKPVQDRVSLIQQITTPKLVRQYAAVVIVGHATSNTWPGWCCRLFFDTSAAFYHCQGGINVTSQCVVSVCCQVSALTFNGNSTVLASAQTGIQSVVRVWNYLKANCLAMFKTHAHSLSSLSFSYSGGVLCGVGKDGHSKTMVVVWNTLRVTKGGEVSVLAKAHTDVDIQTMKISFFDDTRMVSCGRDNVRLWRVRSGALRSCPVNLGEYHALDFTDVAFEEGHSADREPEDRTLFASSRSGHILEIDYGSVAIKNVRRLLPAQQPHSQRREKQTFGMGLGIAVNSISVSSAFCATGSEDGFLRLWPLDFSTVFLEAEHEGPVSLVSVSDDGLSVMAATTSGNLGYLDVSSRGYSTLMRSHTDGVLGFSVDGIRRRITTASCDRTVRVWDMDSMQQLYDFVSEDTPCSVAFHPSLQVFSCGSSSGLVRVFDIASAKLLAEHRQHRGEVVGLAFSPDGEFMYSAGSLGSLALYNSSQEDHHVLRVLGNVVARGTERAPDALTVSSDNRCLAFVGPSEYTVTIMAARSLDELLRVDVSILDVESTTLDSALKVCFSPASTGHLLVTTSANKILWISANTGRLLREVSKVHKHQCSSLAVSEDGRFLLTAGHNAVKVWDYNAIPSQMFIGHSQPIRQVNFTPDQMAVVSVGDAIFFWDFLAHPQETGTDRCSPPKAASVSPPKPGLLSKHSVCLSPSQSTATPELGEEGLSLKAVIGYNGNGRANMVWNPETGLFAYSCGCVVVVENLHTGSQRHWLGHTEEISCLAVTNDAQTVASAAGGSGGSRSLICIWNVQDGTCGNTISYHRGAVQALSFSRDDFFFLTVGDFTDPEVALWSTRTYQLLSRISVSGPLHDVAFCPSAASQLACVGSHGLYFCNTHTQGLDVELKVQRVCVPEEVGDVELTALCYNANSILFTGTNSGHVCAWDCNTQRCFMTWEADQGEIGVLLCRGNRLLTGSNTRRLRLWGVAAVQGMRGALVLLEQEMMLDGTVVSAAFDDVMDMGIVGTTAGTLWYINWVDNTSIRLISGHKSRVNDVVFSPDESHFATCGEDGSVRVWTAPNNELVVQFQVLNQSCGSACWSPVSPSKGGACVVGGYSDGTLRIFRLASSEMELKLHPHPVAVTAIQYSANGQVILSAGRDGLMAVSSPVTGLTVRLISDHKGAPITTIQCVKKQYKEFGLEGNEMWLAASADRRVSVWAADWMKDKCELLDWLTFPAPANPEESDSLPPSLAAFSPIDPGLVVYTGYGVERELSFYSLAKKRVIKKIALSHWAMCFSLSSKGRLIAVGSKERVLKLIKSSSGRFQDFLHHSDSLQTCRFSPSGKLLFTVAYNEILLWEVRGL
uniref:WD repeat-containing protein 90 n=1 Tax=Oncorhynchus mykiss TaxID=8022 RepID=A0A8C7RGB2_ONCMY